ncbi:MAG: hypothetical protein II111_03830, partial [Oscillospiraceae bacterium]|nr:hypothetical protein [Oscillospiraceae bacterium]
VYLNLCGTKSGTYVYVNGEEVGYCEDSKDLARFRITDYLRSPVQRIQTFCFPLPDGEAETSTECRYYITPPSPWQEEETHAEAQQAAGKKSLRNQQKLLDNRSFCVLVYPSVARAPQGDSCARRTSQRSVGAMAK